MRKDSSDSRADGAGDGLGLAGPVNLAGPDGPDGRDGRDGAGGQAGPDGREPALALRDVTRRHGRGRGAVHALRGVGVRLAKGSFTAVMGPSGSGKSTLLQCAAGLDRPTSGSVRLDGQELCGMGERRLTRLRRTRVGFVFQSFNLLPALTVEQNVLLPLRLAGGGRDRARARDMLDRVGLADRARSRPGQLSGGQQQRVAVARALITEPRVVCADEPTGALDPTTAEEVLALLRGAVTELGSTLLMVTHDPAAAAWADRVLFLADGLLVDEWRPVGGPVAGAGHGGPGTRDTFPGAQRGGGAGTGAGATAGAGAGAGAAAAAGEIAARMRALSGAPAARGVPAPAGTQQPAEGAVHV